MMISVCGVVCSDCPAFDGAAQGPQHQQRTVEAWRRIYSLSEAPERIACGGCLGSDVDLFHTSGNCAARRCCLSKGFSSCAECAEDSCTDLEKAQAVWDGVPALIDKLSAADFAEYARPYCDHRIRLAALRVSFQGKGHDRFHANRPKPNQT